VPEYFLEFVPHVSQKDPIALTVAVENSGLRGDVAVPTEGWTCVSSVVVGAGRVADSWSVILGTSELEYPSDGLVVALVN
jgi:hypothetical protein